MAILVQASVVLVAPGGKCIPWMKSVYHLTAALIPSNSWGLHIFNDECCLRAQQPSGECKKKKKIPYTPKKEAYEAFFLFLFCYVFGKLLSG